MATTSTLTKHEEDRVSEISYNSVVTGLLPFGLGLDVLAGLDDLGSITQGPHSYIQRVKNAEKAGPWYRFSTIDGERADLTSLPPDGSDLTYNQANLILNRFIDRYEGEKSAGNATVCFETHVHYVLGSGVTLSDDQIRLLVGLCRVAGARPAPVLTSIHQVLLNLNSPRTLKTVVAASIWSKLHHLRRLKQYTSNLYNLVASGSNEEISVLMLGFSRSQLSLARPLHDLAESDGRSIQFILPGVYAGKEGYSDARQTEAAYLLDDTNVRHRVVPAARLHKLPIDFALASTKVWTMDRSQGVTALVSRDAQQPFKQLCLEHQSQGTAHAIPKVICVAGFYKMWPAIFRNVYHKIYAEKSGDGILDDIWLLNRRHISHIFCERGLISLDKVGEQVFSNENDIRRLVEEVVTRTSSAWSARDLITDAISDLSLREIDANKSQGRFKIEAQFIGDLIFSEFMPEPSGLLYRFEMLSDPQRFLRERLAAASNGVAGLDESKPPLWLSDFSILSSSAFIEQFKSIFLDKRLSSNQKAEQYRGIISSFRRTSKKFPNLPAEEKTGLPLAINFFALFAAQLGEENTSSKDAFSEALQKSISLAQKGGYLDADTNDSVGFHLG